VVQHIREILGGGIEAFGLRDDAGVLALPGTGPAEGERSLIVSVDTVVEGVHVDPALCGPPDIGWKALMGALSDLAAVGADPLGALVALCVPAGSGSGELAVGVMEGVAEAAQTSGCAVVGGDVSSAAQVVVSVTVLGTVEGGGPPPVSRSGGQAGDVIMVTGPCGGSAAGLRTLRAGPGPRAAGRMDAAATCAARAYCRPVARLGEGTTARRAGAHAMIDVSDGLALDLHRLADASGAGFELARRAIPLGEGATLAEALQGGEDYELVVVADEAASRALAADLEASGLRRPVRIGMLVADPAVRTLDGDPLPRVGWQHRLA
jgi:thiamine-monophosphate kinase